MPSRWPATSPWLTRRAVAAHVALAVLVPAFVALAWWQVRRAESGNTLSYVYAAEWPLLAGYAVFMWWKIVHEVPEVQVGEVQVGEVQVGEVQVASDPRFADIPPGSWPDEEEDAELASYNRYLAALHASGTRKHW